MGSAEVNYHRDNDESHIFIDGCSKRKLYSRRYFPSLFVTFLALSFYIYTYPDLVLSMNTDLVLSMIEQESDRQLKKRSQLEFDLLSKYAEILTSVEESDPEQLTSQLLTFEQTLDRQLKFDREEVKDLKNREYEMKADLLQRKLFVKELDPLEKEKHQRELDFLYMLCRLQCLQTEQVFEFCHALEQLQKVYLEEVLQFEKTNGGANEFEKTLKTLQDHCTYFTLKGNTGVNFRRVLLSLKEATGVDYQNVLLFLQGNTGVNFEELSPDEENTDGYFLKI